MSITPDIPELNDREKTVLEHIIRQYVMTAHPVGSRTISKQMDVALSAASIRNVMSDLEEKGFIDHPHTSAGRIPTDVGYRYYVDELVQEGQLRDTDRQLINLLMQSPESQDFEGLLKSCSSLLGKISHQLAVVSSPQIGSGRLRSLDLVQVSSNKILVILSIVTGLVKTMVLEIHSEYPREQLEQIKALLNERLAGLTLREIRETFHERIKDAHHDHGLIRLFIESSDKVFSDHLDPERVHIEGMLGVLDQPEFEDPAQLKKIVEIVENQNVIIHILDEVGNSSSLSIRIGSENKEVELQDYSIIATPYQYGPLNGTIGVFGPRRMDYARMIAVVQHVAKILCQ
ncbi:MAG: heat-inducible transcription repressor HrcA [Ectothiorhodospiraceae bacterium]|nr:heat-inducible transcription repressor HrcA [Ectothiorhodospiraceae bacterium]